MKNLAKKRYANLAAAPAEGFAVDASAGIIRNVALMTVGDALGYWFTIDAATLTTAFAAIKARGGKLRIYPTHAHSGCTHCTDDESDDVGSELNYAAYADGIAIKGAQLVAASVQFYDTFRKNYEPIYDNLMELATKTPDLLGLSMEPVYHCVYVGKDGVEYSARPEGIDLVSEMPVMRVDEIYAAAFGALPATNTGLFATLSAKFGGKQLRKLARKLAAELRADPETAAAAELTAPPKPAAVHSAAPNKHPSITPEISHLMKIIADLQAKFGSDDKRLGQAMLIVGKTPAASQAALTVEAVEAAMTAADLTAATGRVAQLTADLTAANTAMTGLQKQVTDLTAELGVTKEQLKTAKTSGTTAVDLGAASSGAGDITVNPFITGDLTAQARLSKADPARANALMESAKAAKAAKP